MRRSVKTRKAFVKFCEKHFDQSNQDWGGHYDLLVKIHDIKGIDINTRDGWIEIQTSEFIRQREYDSKTGSCSYKIRLHKNFGKNREGEQIAFIPNYYSSHTGGISIKPSNREFKTPTVSGDDFCLDHRWDQSFFKILTEQRIDMVIMWLLEFVKNAGFVKPKEKKKVAV